MQSPMVCNLCFPTVGGQDVEPICSVAFGTMSNPSCTTVNCDAGFVDYTSTVTAPSVAQAASYTLSVSGNTNGSYTTYFTAFFDWDQNGTFEDVKPIGSITNEVCVTTLTLNVTIPPTAALGTTRMRIIKNFSSSPTDPCGTYSYGQAEDYNLNVVLGSCMPPTATATLTPNCVGSTFTVPVNLTGLGSASNVDIIENVNGGGNVVVHNDVSGLTTYAMGPYAMGSTVNIRVLHNSDNTCDVNLGNFTYAAASCPMIVNCGTPTIESYCYPNYDAHQWKYASSAAFPLKLSFSAGYIENGSDPLRIYDGTDATGTLLFDSFDPAFLPNDLTGITVTANSGNIFMNFTSDLSINCSSGAQWAWTVVCLTCLPPNATATVVPACPGGFGVDVNITSFGSGSNATINYSVNGTAQTPIPVSVTGTTSLTGFTNGADVDITVLHSSDPLCNVSLNNNTFFCAPVNDNCGNATALTINPDYNCGTTTHGTVGGATASGDATSPCFGTPDDDVWYSFTATSAIHNVSLLNVAGSVTDMYMAVYGGACGSLVNLACSDPNSVSVTGLTVGLTYLVRVYTYTSTPGQTTQFDICVGTAPGAPANDNCANAVALTVNPNYNCGAVTHGSVASATASGDATSPCFGSPDDDVWYSFTATGAAHQVKLINVTGSITDMYMAFYSGTCGSLVNVACSDPDIANLTGLSIGTTYYVRVYTYTSTPGQTTQFDICVGTPPPPPANDNCANAVVLTVNPDYSCGSVTNGTITSATASGDATAPCFGT